MNENIIDMIKAKDFSIYRMSQETGIPYTTLSEIANQKININKCTAETVYKLTLYFGCSMEDILNPIILVANMTGIYRNIKFKWIENGKGSADLVINDHGTEKIAEYDQKLTQGRFYKEYKLLTESIIDVYLLQQEAEAMVND